MITVLLADQMTWHIPFLLSIIVMTVIYCFYCKNRSYKRIEQILFLSGIWSLYFLVGSPLLAFSYLAFSFHMIHMSILFFIIPPLILLGTPQALYTDVIKPFLIKFIPFRMSPKIALILFATLFFLYHLPFILTIISKYSTVQKGYLSILFLISFRMWWPIAAPDRNERLFHAERRSFILKSSLYITPACLMFVIGAFLDGMNNPILGQVAADLCLPTNGTVQILPAPFHTKYDQMLAGLFMLAMHKAGLMATSKLEGKC